MKDVNLQHLLLKDPNLVNIKLEHRTQIIKQLSKDTKFLAERNIMDYSLLLVIE